MTSRSEDNLPKRIQRRRTKGWRMPEGVVYVGRPTRWGNPFNLRDSNFCWLSVSLGCRGDPAGRQKASVLLFRAWVSGACVEGTHPTGLFMSSRKATKSVSVGPDLTVPKRPDPADYLAALRGKDLACWCALDAPCHADVLLELANAPPKEESDGSSPKNPLSGKGVGIP